MNDVFVFNLNGTSAVHEEGDLQFIYLFILVIYILIYVSIYNYNIPLPLSLCRPMTRGGRPLVKCPQVGVCTLVHTPATPHHSTIKAPVPIYIMLRHSPTIISPSNRARQGESLQYRRPPTGGSDRRATYSDRWTHFPDWCRHFRGVKGGWGGAPVAIFTVFPLRKKR